MSEKANPTEEKWREATKICEHILSDRVTFDKEETNYKLEISNRVKTLFDALEKDEDFVPLLKKAFSSPNNLTSFYAHTPLIEWAAAYPDDERKALLDLTSRKHSVENRINLFLNTVPADKPSGFGTRLTIASFFLMGLNPQNHPMY